MSAPSPNRIPVHDVDATKKRIHPRFTDGFYQRIRVFSMYFLLALFLIDKKFLKPYFQRKMGV